MENIVSEMIAQWGTFGLLMLFAIWIIYSNVKDGFKINKKKDTSNQSESRRESDTLGELMASLIDRLSTKIDKIDDKVDRIEINSNNLNNRLTVVETKINQQPQAFINHFNK